MKARIHWLWLVWPLWRPLATGGAILSANRYAIGVVTVAWIFWLLAWIHTDIEVGRKGVTIRTGVIFQDEAFISIRGIEFVEVHQSILGRIFDFGRVEISGTGENHGNFALIARPHQLKAHILSLM